MAIDSEDLPLPSPSRGRFSLRRRFGVLVVGGELDSIGAPWLAAALEPLLAIGGHLRISLREVTFLGSPGLHVLADAAGALTDRGRLVILNPSTAAERAIHAAGLRGSLDIVANPQLRVAR